MYAKLVSICHSFGGFVLVKSFLDTWIILAPSEKEWNTFVEEKLKGIELSRPKSLEVPFDSQKMFDLVKNDYPSSLISGGFVKDSSGKHKAHDSTGKWFQGYYYETMSFYMDHESLGEITVRTDTGEILSDFKHEKFQPIIDITKEVLKSFGTGESVISCLMKIHFSKVW